MSRPLRIEYPGAWYHVRQNAAFAPLFATKEDHRYFLRLLGRTASNMQLRVVAYALLPACYHLVVQTRLPNLGGVMRRLNGDYARRRRENGGGDTIFEGRYKAALLEPEGYLAQVVRHVHKAPLDEGGGKEMDKAWSSYRAYLQKRHKPDWLDTGCVLEHFPGDQLQRREACKRFMAQDETPQFRALYARGRLPTLLGSDDFLALHKRLARQKPEGGARPSFRDAERRVRDAICRSFGVAQEELFEARRGKSNPARGAYVYLLRRAAGLSVAQIADLVGASGHSSVSSAVQRFADRLRKDAGLRALVDEAQGVLERKREKDLRSGGRQCA